MIILTIIIILNCSLGFADNRITKPKEDRSKTASDLMVQAWDLEKKGQDKDAVKLYESIIEKYPDTGIIWQVITSYAKMYEKKGDTDKAIDIYEKAIAKTQNMSAMYFLADLYAFKKNNIEKSLEWYIKISKSPDYSTGYDGGKCGALIKLINDNKDDINQDALKLFFQLSDSIIDTEEDILKKAEVSKRLVSHYPKSKLAGVAQYLMGYIYEYKILDYSNNSYKLVALHNYDAIDAYRKVISEYPGECWNYYLPEFYESADRLVNIPIAYIAQFRIGKIYQFNLREYKQAIVEYDKLVSKLSSSGIDSGNLYYHLGTPLIIKVKQLRAECYEQLKEYDKAIEEYSNIANEIAGEKIRFQESYHGGIIEWKTIDPECQKLIKLAENAVYNKKYKDAFNVYKDIIVNYPERSYSDEYDNAKVYAVDAIEGVNEMCLNKMQNAYEAIELLQELGNLVLTIQINDGRIKNRVTLKARLMYSIALIYENKLRDYDKAMLGYENIIGISNQILVENIQPSREMGPDPGTFLGVSLSYSGMAKYRIEELSALKEKRRPFLSIFYPKEVYVWDKMFAVIDYPDPMELCSWQYIANISRSARNEIYARHGYMFSSPDLQQQFKKYSWYKPDTNFKETMLSEIEKRNVKYMKQFEDIVKAGRSDREIKDYLLSWTTKTTAN